MRPHSEMLKMKMFSGSMKRNAAKYSTQQHNKHNKDLTFVACTASNALLFTVQGNPKTGPLCFTACNIKIIDQIGTKFGTNRRYFFIRNKFKVWKMKWRYL